MISQSLIKVVKRAERERLEQQAAVGTNHEPHPRRKARALAATVKGWVSEFEQARPVQLRELRQQLGWSEIPTCGTESEVAAERRG